nr:PREDICTED: zinc finger E-box-binding homeobox 1-like [Paralichthys olivaceus]
MADGPRCKRRKQANPKRSSVTDFNNGLEASSDSDDEDKLHIVEEDSLQEPEVASAEGTTPQDSHDATATVLPLNGSWNGAHPTQTSAFISAAVSYSQAGNTKTMETARM